MSGSITSLDGSSFELYFVHGPGLTLYRYWQVYQTSAYPFYPGLVTFSQFERALFAFIDQRANASRGNELSALDDVDPSWLALLFAVLAGGVQFSDDPIKERDLRSKVFSKCSNTFKIISYVLERSAANFGRSLLIFPLSSRLEFLQ